MEELLNKLIEKGWKPFGKDYEEYANGCLIYSYKGKFDIFSVGKYPTTYRELVSKESGLWQFVCENGMLRYAGGDRAKNYDEYANECDDCCRRDGYQYRLIESSLKDESELEEFLLENIKVE